jgi:hypothetical protein
LDFDMNTLFSLLLVVAALLCVIPSVYCRTDAADGCPGYTEPNPPYETRTDAMIAAFHFCTGRYQDYQCSMNEFTTRWALYTDPIYRDAYNGGYDLMAPCVTSAGKLSFQTCLAKCAVLPTSTETGHIQMVDRNFINGMTFNKKLDAVRCT